jgi:terminase small subunit / prophage DNA-packing protein
MSDAEKPKVRGVIVNRAELASLYEVSLPTVDAWVRRGCPVIERGSKGREWKFSTADIFDWRVESAVRDAMGRR